MTPALHAFATAAVPVLQRAGGGTGGGHSGGGGGGGFSGGGGGGTFVGGGGGGGFGVIIAIFVLVLVISFLSKRAKAKRRSFSQPPVPPSVGGSPLPPPGSASGITIPPDLLGMTGVNGNGRGNGHVAAPDDGELHVASNHAELVAGVEEIKAHDPAFDPDEMLANANRAFFVIQEGWSFRKPELTRKVMADGIWNQHRMQILQYQQSGRFNRLDNLAVQNSYIVGANCDVHHDEVIVRFFASSADYDVDEKSGKKVRGHTDIQEWCEDWVFQRSNTATTRADGGTLGQHCPNCGAPLDVDLTGVCSYCKVPVMGGDLDWVLVRIDQLPTWEYVQQTLPR